MYSQSLPEGTTTALKVSGRLRVQTTYARVGVEMVEEWSSTTSLLSRRWRKSSALGGETGWEYEIGSPPVGKGEETGGIMKAADVNPKFIPKDEEGSFVYTVMNCPWGLDNYNVTYDGDKDEFVLRTGNKKFYKRWSIPALRRQGIRGEGLGLKTEWKADGENVLVVRVEKPDEVKVVERKRREERGKAAEKAGEGGVDCKQS